MHLLSCKNLNRNKIISKYCVLITKSLSIKNEIKIFCRIKKYYYFCTPFGE